MFALAFHEAKIKYWDFDLKGALIATIVSFGYIYWVYSTTKQIDAVTIILSLLFTILAYVLYFGFGLLLTLVQRMYWVGYLGFSIYKSTEGDGVVDSDGDQYVTIYVHSLEAQHHANPHFRCYGRFARVQEVERDSPIISNSIQYLSWAGKRKPGKSFEYGEIPDGNNVVHFARIDREKNRLIFFTTSTELTHVKPGIYDVDIIIGGICKEFDKSIRARKFTGRVYFDRDNNARLENRKTAARASTKTIKGTQQKRRKKSS